MQKQKFSIDEIVINITCIPYVKLFTTIVILFTVLVIVLNTAVYVQINYYFNELFLA